MTSTPTARKKVLLVSGAAPEDARLALARGGYEVRQTGWLDALTAVRVERPDVVVIAGVLAHGAAEMLVRAFGSPDVWSVPLVLADVPEELRVHPALLLKVHAVADAARPEAIVDAVDRALGSPVPKLDMAALFDVETPRKRVRFALGFIAAGAGVLHMLAEVLLSPEVVRSHPAERSWWTLASLAVIGWGVLAFRDARSRWRRAGHVLAILWGAAMLGLLWLSPRT